MKTKNETMPSGVRRHTRRNLYRSRMANEPRNLLGAARTLSESAYGILEALDKAKPSESAVCGMLVASAQTLLESALRRTRMLRRALAIETKREATGRTRRRT